MDYYLNEYSLRGQFKDVDKFFESLRAYTLPVLKKIEEEKGSLVWKKDTFWQLEICKGITLVKIPQKKNERSSEGTALRIQLIKLIREEPFWESGSETSREIKEYKFDEDYREHFEKSNCFSKALESEGRIVSFIHPAYKIPQLPVIVGCDGTNKKYVLDNIFETAWWKNEPIIKTWNISRKYTIQVRAKEFDYHPPHFHVVSNEYDAVFKLSNGELYTYGKKKWTTQMIAEVQKWYRINKQELQEAWNNLHNG